MLYTADVPHSPHLMPTTPNITWIYPAIVLPELIDCRKKWKDYRHHPNRIRVKAMVACKRCSHQSIGIESLPKNIY
jgi:hypothetical protein